MGHVRKLQTRRTQCLTLAKVTLAQRGPQNAIPGRLLPNWALPAALFS